VLATLGWLAVAAAAMAGHIFPPWLRFKGGKGVATGLGAVLGLYPLLTIAGLVAGGIWPVVTWFTGYISVGSIVAALALPPIALVAGLVLDQAAGETALLVAVTLLLAALVVVRHRGNIARLRAGTEEKVTWARRSR
jgi:glycerol-3-phosphate acyltransferase PlsY